MEGRGERKLKIPRGHNGGIRKGWQVLITQSLDLRFATQYAWLIQRNTKIAINPYKSRLGKVFI